MRQHLQACLFLLFAFLSAASQASTISYDLHSLGGNRYSYDYVFTPTPSMPVQSFAIYFPFHLYANLAPSSLPVGWMAMLTQPNPALYEDGIFMAESTSGPMPIGVPSGGFGIEFDWLGTGLPGPQGFLLYDSPSFGFGNSEVGGTVAVPEPGSLALSLLALGLMGYRRSRPTIPVGKK